MHKIALVQFNPTVGDLIGNYHKIFNYYQQAVINHTQLIIFPELALIGYPAKDLLLSESFKKQALLLQEKLIKLTANNELLVIIGGIELVNEKLYNSAFLIKNGCIINTIRKSTLAVEEVFDEQRTFKVGELPDFINLLDSKVGLIICEDLWNDRAVNKLKEQQIKLLIIINCSPFENNKLTKRLNLIKNHLAKTTITAIYLNIVGAQDELVFDGQSFITDSNQHIVMQLNAFSEELAFINWTADNRWFYQQNNPLINNSTSQESLIYQALMLGIKDYVNKNNFNKIIIGLSGGIDSALTAAICVDALGHQNVELVMLPTIYTSPTSHNDAKTCADLLGVSLKTIDIKAIVDSFEVTLAPYFTGSSSDITEENLQARTRAVILMALGNKFNYLLVSTGNKSELAVGYATLYGDMCGSFNLLKDLYKTQVFQLANWRNNYHLPTMLGKPGEVIPINIITKAPSAELKFDQKDEDNLPPYELLDQILFGLIEQRLSIEQLVKLGFEQELVTKINNLLYKSEYKRYQSAPGVKLSTMSFGLDRRYPITNKWTN